MQQAKKKAIKNENEVIFYYTSSLYLVKTLNDNLKKKKTTE